MKTVSDGDLQAARALLLAVLHEPSRLGGLSLRAWGELIPLAKFTGLWPQIAAQACALRASAIVPQPVRPHLQSAEFAAAAHETTMRWEIDRLQAALADVHCPIILLKGSAYLQSGFAFAQGRVFGDIDILVPKRWLTPVETALLRRGWVFASEDPLHQQYYRTWLQELAPMWHHERKVQVDIHHTIIPPKDRIALDPQLLYDAAVPIGDGRLRVLAPADMFLHAATHSFRTGEFRYLLRDLRDMNEMITTFATQPDFWDLVLTRAAALGLKRPCFYALRYLRDVCKTPVPAAIVQATAAWRPGPVALGLADALVRRALIPKTLDRVDWGRNAALTLLEYWPPPRVRTVLSPLFWRKRLAAKQGAA